MSSPSFDATIDLALRPSVRALTLLFWLHVAVLIFALSSVPAGWPMSALAAGVAVSWLWTRRHAVFGYGRRALVRLTWHPDGRWTVGEAAGPTQDAELLGNSLVHDWLLVLNFRLPDGRRRSRALLGDELDEEPLRRLRARLNAARRG